MDRKENKRLDGIFHKISSQELIGAELQESKLIYNVVGFLQMTDSTDASLIISNLGYLLAQKGLNTCLIDFNVFYPNLHTFFNVKTKNKGEGLLKVLKSDKTDIREELIHTSEEKLFLLSASNQDSFEEYFDFTFEHIEQVITLAKNTFDIVLINIPNNPPLEFCIGAVKYCHTGFVIASEKIEASRNITKFFDYATSIGVSTAKFANLIMMNLHDLQYDYKVFEDHGIKLVSTIPFVKGAIVYSLEGIIYLKNSKNGINKYFLREMNRLAKNLSEQ